MGVTDRLGQQPTARTRTPFYARKPAVHRPPQRRLPRPAVPGYCSPFSQARQVIGLRHLTRHPFPQNRDTAFRSQREWQYVHIRL